MDLELERHLRGQVWCVHLQLATLVHARRRHVEGRLPRFRTQHRRQGLSLIETGQVEIAGLRIVGGVGDVRLLTGLEEQELDAAVLLAAKAVHSELFDREELTETE